MRCGLSQPGGSLGAGEPVSLLLLPPPSDWVPFNFLLPPGRGWGPIAQPGGPGGCFHLHLCFRLGASAHQGGGCMWVAVLGGCGLLGDSAST